MHLETIIRNLLENLFEPYVLQNKTLVEPIIFQTILRFKGADYEIKITKVPLRKAWKIF